MTRGRRAIAVICIIWAVLAPLYLWYRGVQQELPRRLKALAVVAQGARPEEYGTNAAVQMRAFGQSLANLEKMQEQELANIETVAFISSGLIVVLSLISFFARSNPENRST